MKRIFFLILLHLVVFPLHGQIISSSDAAIVSENFIQKITGINSRTSSITPLYRDTIVCLYLIKHENNKWCIIPSSMEIPPILAYGWSDIEDEDTPEAFDLLIETFKETVYSIITGNKENGNTDDTWNILFHPERYNHYEYNVGDSLLDMTGRNNNGWKQSKNNENTCTPSYNTYCPSSNNSGCNCEHKHVGCGAVAMGQIMWYWHWPKSSEFRTYHWERMSAKLFSTTPTENAAEVAQLLFDCGVAAEMDYNCFGSYTISNKIIKAYKECFGYNSVEKKYASDWEYHNSWRDLITSEIDNGRPVLYYADTSSFLSGHFFVIDGYFDLNSLRLFHVNWGHGGTSNCFCPIDRLQEGSDHYYKHNRAIVGISPTYNESSITSLNYSELQYGHRKEYAYNTIVIPCLNNTLKIRNGASYSIEAGNEIILQDGFEAEAGSDFEAHINPAWQSHMAISVPEWPTIVGSEGYCISPQNADSWEFTIMDRNNVVMFQSAGSIRSDQICLWDGSGITDGAYLCIVTLKNSYGRSLHHEYIVTVINRSISDGTDTTTDGANLRKNIVNCFAKKTDSTTLQVIPNPSDGLFNIILPSDTIIRVEVYNTRGQLVYVDDNIMLSSYILNLLEFPRGNYIAVTRSRQKAYSAMFIKQ